MTFEGSLPWRPDFAQEICHRGVATLVSHIAYLPQKPGAGEIGKGQHALPQICLEGLDGPRPRRTRPVDRSFKSPVEMSADGLAVAADLPRDGADAQPLLLQIMDQDDLPQSFHLMAPTALFGGSIRQVARGGADFRIDEVRKSPAPLTSGEISNSASGEITNGGYTLSGE